MREYVRVPILVSAGVLLCAYKLGFGLVQNFLENSKFPLFGLTGQFSVHRHYAVQCPVHRLGTHGSATMLPCPVVHRTVTMRCLVCP
jgi:hypothetical protein